MYPIQDTDIVKTIINYHKEIAGCILYKILILYIYYILYLYNYICKCVSKGIIFYVFNTNFLILSTAFL